MEGPKTEKIEALFDSIAGDYDALNHLLSLGVDRLWRKRALKEIFLRREQDRPGDAGIAPSASLEILDLACGTGDFALEMARRARKKKWDVHITGLDLSAGMLDIMRQKVFRAGFGDSAASSLKGQVAPTISTVQGNSEALPFEEGSFDRVTIAFGIRNFEHREVALREILRVLKSGGRLIILELSVPANPVLRWAYNLYFTRILPLIGGWISGDKAAYRYLPASVLRFPGKREWMETMRSCGFENVRHRAFSLGICRMYVGEK